MEHLIVGVSVYVERPIEAKSKNKVTAFTHANQKKIINLKPDLVLGFSDIQKDIARDLIGAGLNVFITNQRSIEEIFQYLFWLGSLVGCVEKTQKYLNEFKEKIECIRGVSREYRSKVYIEEWDEPTIIGIRWFTELVEICGGEVLFREKSLAGNLAMERTVTHEEILKENPDIILVCWCGKKFDRESFVNRSGFKELTAVKEEKIYELDPAIFLQPGPALFKDGIDILSKILSEKIK
jgi:iron complex transport system substrate-binding protein